ncbi:MAG: hypothetical protein ACFFA3_03770 [Promethearchaeota archaeon]
MKESKFAYIVIFFFISLVFLNKEISNSKANLAPIQTSEFGGFIPKVDSSCFMPNASVLIEINATYLDNHFDLEFSGNYTLYNPNETLNLTIAAPFSDHLLGLNSTCTIKMNDSILPYEIIEYESGEHYSWDDYINMVHRNLIVCNITLLENKTTILKYNFKTIFVYDVGILSFHYDIGTARIWNGTISEIIEFRVFGQQPDTYNILSSQQITFEIIEIPNGNRYIWGFKNVLIPPGLESVYISYDNYNNPMLTVISMGDSFVVFLLLGIVSLIKFIYKRKKLRSSY